MKNHLISLLIAVMFWLPATAFAGPVDINTADAQTIARELEGIGLARARAIVAYREQHGAFTRVEDLAQVKGVGPKILELNRPNIRLGEPQTP